MHHLAISSVNTTCDEGTRPCKRYEKIFAGFNQVFILAVATLLISCGRGDRQPIQPPVGVEQEIEGFSLTHMQMGHTRWKLSAKVAHLMESNVVKLENIELVIFGDKSGETVRINGDRGEVNQATYDVKMTGNVEGVFSNGGRLTTEELYWRDGEKKIHTPPGKKVTIIYEDSIITGEELSIKPETETATLKNVTGVTHVEEKREKIVD